MLLDIQQTLFTMKLCKRTLDTFKFTTELDKKQISTCIIEAFDYLLVSISNTNQTSNTSMLSVYRLIDPNNEIDSCIIKEFSEKIINIIVGDGRLKKLLTWKAFIVRSINEYILEQQALTRYEINLLESHDYLELMIDSNLFIKTKRTERVIKMLKHNSNHFMMCLIRYNIFHPYLAFFEMTNSCLYLENVSQYDNLSLFNNSNNVLNVFRKHNINLQLYATPFNNVFNIDKDTYYCSNYYESDYCFNSVGDVKDIAFDDNRFGNCICILPNNRWLANKIMDKINTFNSKNKCIILFIPVNVHKNIDINNINGYIESIKILKMYDSLTNKKITLHSEYYIHTYGDYNNMSNLYNDIWTIIHGVETKHSTNYKNNMSSEYYDNKNNDKKFITHELTHELCNIINNRMNERMKE
jgi:hypothetical protein